MVCGRVGNVESRRELKPNATDHGQYLLRRCRLRCCRMGGAEHVKTDRGTVGREGTDAPV
jgi:hypothetical protein